MTLKFQIELYIFLRLTLEMQAAACYTLWLNSMVFIREDVMRIFSCSNHHEHYFLSVNIAAIKLNKIKQQETIKELFDIEIHFQMILHTTTNVSVLVTKIMWPYK